jgi:hypothetical protein
MLGELCLNKKFLQCKLLVFPCWDMLLHVSSLLPSLSILLKCPPPALTSTVPQGTSYSWAPAPSPWEVTQCAYMTGCLPGWYGVQMPIFVMLFSWWQWLENAAFARGRQRWSGPCIQDLVPFRGFTSSNHDLQMPCSEIQVGSLMGTCKHWGL